MGTRGSRSRRQFLGFGEWPVDDFDLSTGQLDADTLSGLLESAASFEDAGSDPSSLSFAIASLSALGGGGQFPACLTIIMNCTGESPFGFGLELAI
jgi:hypothetical protein